MNLQSCVKVLEQFAPLAHAEKWDNVGLLVEPPSLKTVSRIMLVSFCAILDRAVAADSSCALHVTPTPDKRLDVCSARRGTRS